MVTDKVNPPGGLTIIACEECGQNYGLVQKAEEGTVAIIEAHNKNHDNVFYLTPPPKVTA